ncbi:hypothetical protein [Haloarchaeobius litoreus]|uniref:PGF-CTERM protein n=1 Tax=Haloarchaeobius litoreus TaxID=755306 RepID=A0ABD6DIG0_9EURY|nr:hypothetical protein [Haloarchaeobius litoreus]
MIVAPEAGKGGGTRLRDKQDDEKDEPVSLAANTRYEKADSLQSGDSSGSTDSDSGGSSTSGGSSNRRLGREVGSADLTIGLDEDGRAQETLSGMGSGGSNSTEGVTTEDTTKVATVTSDQTVEEAESTEQAVENATDGRAYGNPNETEDIGTGAAVTSGGSSGSGGSAGELLDALPVDNLLIAALAMVGVAVAAGGGDGG